MSSQSPESRQVCEEMKNHGHDEILEKYPPSGDQTLISYFHDLFKGLFPKEGDLKIHRVILI